MSLRGELNSDLAITLSKGCFPSSLQPLTLKSNVRSQISFPSVFLPSTWTHTILFSLVWGGKSTYYFTDGETTAQISKKVEVMLKCSLGTQGQFELSFLSLWEGYEIVTTITLLSRDWGSPFLGLSSKINCWTHVTRTPTLAYPNQGPFSWLSETLTLSYWRIHESLQISRGTRKDDRYFLSICQWTLTLSRTLVTILFLVPHFAPMCCCGQHTVIVLAPFVAFTGVG